MFTKEDKRFETMAMDPLRRRAGISDLSRRRIVLAWCAIAISVCAIAVSWSGKSSALIFSAAIAWSLVFKSESELRLLRVVERLQRDSHERPVG